MRLSVIVPVLNEAEEVRDFIFHLRARLPEAEILVVDGGSEDETWGRLEALRESYALRLLRAPRGRAPQMNAGACAAKGEVLLFLHADCRLPPHPGPAVAALLANERISGGCFRLRFPRPECIYRISDSLGNVAVDLFQIALGDHAIFCRRAVFRATGGFPLVPLMEDAQFYRALRRLGQVRQLRLHVETSARRYEELGRCRTTLFYLFVLALYLLRVRPQFLGRCHRRFTGMRAGSAPSRGSRPAAGATARLLQ